MSANGSSGFVPAVGAYPVPVRFTHSQWNNCCCRVVVFPPPPSMVGECCAASTFASQRPVVELVAR